MTPLAELGPIDHSLIVGVPLELKSRLDFEVLGCFQVTAVCWFVGQGDALLRIIVADSGAQCAGWEVGQTVHAVWE